MRYYDVFIDLELTPVPLTELRRIIAQKARIPQYVMMSKSRQADIVMARHAFVFYARKQGESYQNIAGFLRMSNHTSVMNSYKRACELIDTSNKKFDKFIL